MGELFEEVKMFQVKYLCECKGNVLPTGVMLTSDPPKFPHRCNNCGKEYVFDKKYPHIAYQVKLDSD